MTPEKLEDYKVLKDLSVHTKDLFYARWLLEGKDGGYFIYSVDRTGKYPALMPISGHDAMGILVLS